MAGLLRICKQVILLKALLWFPFFCYPNLMGKNPNVSQSYFSCCQYRTTTLYFFIDVSKSRLIYNFCNIYLFVLFESGCVLDGNSARLQQKKRRRRKNIKSGIKKAMWETLYTMSTMLTGSTQNVLILNRCCYCLLSLSFFCSRSRSCSFCRIWILVWFWLCCLRYYSIVLDCQFSFHFRFITTSLLSFGWLVGRSVLLVVPKARKKYFVFICTDFSSHGSKKNGHITENAFEQNNLICHNKWRHMKNDLYSPYAQVKSKSESESESLFTNESVSKNEHCFSQLQDNIMHT